MDDPVAEAGSWSFPSKIDIVHNFGTWEAESGDVPVAQDPESSPYQGKKIDVDHNPQDPEITEANWTPEECVSSRDMRDADDLLQEPGCSSSQGKIIVAGRNPEAAEVNSTAVEVYYAFSRDRKIVEHTPILGMVEFPVPTSKVQDTTNWKVGDLPTHLPPSHPSSGHTHNTSPVQLAQDMCSVKAGKVAYIHSTTNRPVHRTTPKSSKPRFPRVETEVEMLVSSLYEWEDGCIEEGEVGVHNLTGTPAGMASPGVQG